jgi:4-amino-4-deoxy-L-arabinose transferase-like glycosyltransferase
MTQADERGGRDRMETRRTAAERWWPLAAALSIAAVLRVAHVLALRRLPLFDHLMIDSELYDQWARRIEAGHWMPERAFFSDPLYPYVLALLYRVFGHDLLLVRLFQAALGVGTCALVALIAYRISGRRVAITAAFAVALYGPLVFEEGEIEKTALGVFLLAAALALATFEKPAAAFASGLCLGLAALTRGNLLIMLPLGTLWFLRRPERRTWRATAARAGAFLVGSLVSLGPVLSANHHGSGEWILTTAQAGTNFYTGNNPWNDSGSFAPVPFVRDAPAHEQGDYHAKAEALSGRLLTSREVSRFWFLAALRHIREHPAFAAKVFARKFVLFWSDVEIPDGWSFYFVRQWSPALSAAFVTFGLVLPFAVLGLLATFRDNPRCRLLAGFVAAYALSLIAFYVHSRYRIFVVPPVAALAAVGLRSMWQIVGSRAWRTAATRLAAASVVGVFAFTAAPWLVGAGPASYVHNYAHLASIYEDAGDGARAKTLLEEGFRRNPGSASIQDALGTLYLKSGAPDEALPWFARCLETDALYPGTWFRMGQTHAALGNAHLAAFCYRRQLAIQPNHEFARICLEALSSGRSVLGPAR